jgi:hypothetical protein
VPRHGDTPCSKAVIATGLSEASLGVIASEAAAPVGLTE